MSRTLSLDAVGEFSDKVGSDIEALPAMTVDTTTAPARLVALKQKFNELQEKRSSYHNRQGASAGVAILTGGLALLAGGGAAVHQRNKISEVIEKMTDCIGQITAVRGAFADSPGWDAAENQCKLNEKAFGKKALNRKLLHGEL